MKKKYIIALEDRNVWTCGLPAKTLLLSDVSIFGTDLSSVNTGIELTPYTEPDLEQVRKEAYERGAEDMRKALRLLIDCDDDCLTIPDIFKTFREGSYHAVVRKHPAMEIIEKILQYEQRQEEIKVGDEVEGDEDGQRGVVIDSRFENSQVAVLTGNSKVYSWWSKCAIHKTGRHFPEIAEVLEKMRESE